MLFSIITAPTYIPINSVEGSISRRLVLFNILKYSGLFPKCLWQRWCQSSALLRCEHQATAHQASHPCTSQRVHQYASLPPRDRFSHAWDLSGLSHWPYWIWDCRPITCVMQGSWISRCSTKANGVSECLDGSNFSSSLWRVTVRCHPTKLVLEEMLSWAAFMSIAWFYYPSWQINSFCRHGSSPVYTYPCSK